ncbi:METHYLMALONATE-SEMIALDEHYDE DEHYDROGENASE [ACYLATING] MITOCHONDRIAL-LIKE [Salix viminalis]|uniref:METHYLMALONATE-SEMIALDEHYDE DEHYDROGENASE [ACYLATING] MITOCHONDRIAL-LIKE n=1 Tax=Salix viminalis TaxID=40686 RepID=A0A9Q0ZIF0_SALVM|nr:METHYLMALONATE-SEMIALDEHYDE DEHYDROGENASE [ACYLATING] MITOCHONDRIAL-LIKE [Salix viminalis]
MEVLLVLQSDVMLQSTWIATRKKFLASPTLYADSLEEAITIVNRIRYENGASIFTTSGVTARKFQNDVDAVLVGINVSVPVPLPCSSFQEAKVSLAGNLNFCGKDRPRLRQLHDNGESCLA